MAGPIVVIGGGASGLMAAGRAASYGAEVILLEKQGKLGCKLRITGKGRCNITNACSLSEFLPHIAPNKDFLRDAFSKFFVTELLEFFEAHNLPLKTERGNRVFPCSDRASDVIDALQRYVKKNGVDVRTKTRVSALTISDGVVSGVRLKDGKKIGADAVIVATGGLSYPRTGSTGDGYRFAQSAGHSIVTLRPSLVPLEAEQQIADKLNGLTLRNIQASLLINGRRKRSEFGEMMFVDSTLSGPVILTLSKIAVESLDNGDKVEISIDLKPALDERKLDARILRELASNGKERFDRMLKTLLPMALIDTCIQAVDVGAHTPCSQISGDIRRRLLGWIKDFRFVVSKHRPIEEAIITAGGISLRQIDPRTMMSKKVKNLYFAGEVLDLDADTGGFNLQMAFSSGYLAGDTAAKEML